MLTPSTIVSSECTIEISSDGQFGTTAKNVWRQPSRTGDDCLLIKPKKSLNGVYNLTGSHFESLFMDNWDIPHSVPTHILIEKGIHFVSTFPKMPCAFLGTMSLRTAAVLSQTPGQAERFNKRVIDKRR